jgi:hypothetical protein
MRRPGAALLAAIVVVCGGIGATASAGSAAPAWNPQTNTTCNMTGGVLFSPPLKNGAGLPTTAKIKWLWSGCAGSANFVTKGGTPNLAQALVGNAVLSCRSVHMTGLPAMGGGSLRWTPLVDRSNTNTLNPGMKLFVNPPQTWNGNFTASPGPAWLGGPPGSAPFKGTVRVTGLNGSCTAGVPSLSIGGTVTFKS